MGTDRHECQEVLVGRFDVAVDPAGGFTLPEEWRFLAEGEGKVCLMPDPHEKCLILLAEETQDGDVARLERPGKSHAQLMLDQIAKSTCVSPVGESGQIVIPVAQREYAKIKSSATLMGCVRIAKVWATETLNKNEKEDTRWDFIEAVMKK